MVVNSKILKAVQKKMQPPRQKKPIPLAFKLFFLVCFVLIGSAVVRYLEDKHMLDQLQIHAADKEKMQDALGWGSELKIEKTAKPLAKIRFMLRDKSHKPINGAVVNITFLHAEDRNNILTQNSLTVPLTMVEPGVYRGQIELPLPGEWDTSISAQIEQNSYQVSERLMLP
jgi:nitrogen fixation protein FixH